MRIFSIRSSLVRPFPFSTLSSWQLIPRRKTGSPFSRMSLPFTRISRKPTRSLTVSVPQVTLTSYSFGFSGVQSSGFASKTTSPAPFSSWIFRLTPSSSMTSSALAVIFSDSVTFAITCPNVPSGTSAILKVLIWHFGTRISAISRYTPQ